MLCLFIFSIPSNVSAGSFSIPSTTIYGTKIDISVSYPTFRVGVPATVSVAITVNFYNESISAVNITEVQVYLLKLGTNLDEVVMKSNPPFTTQYAYAYWNAYFSKSNPYKIEKPKAYAITSTQSISISLNWVQEVNQETDAILYVRVILYFVDANGEIVVRYSELWGSAYHWMIYSGVGEAPIVTIYPKETTRPLQLKPELLLITSVMLATIIILVFVIKKVRKTHSKSREKTEYLQIKNKIL
ncbi:MAG: hypothetical protein QXO82_05615 [Candidatus Methanomethylicia archaeon]